jgi:polysaccharide biosynthesis protein PslH
MRILFLSQLVPYPVDAGPKVRSYHVLQYLCAAGHEVTLVAFARDSDRPEHIAHLQQICAAVHTVPMVRSRLKDAWFLGQSLLRGQPFLITRDSVAAMQQLIQSLMAERPFDAVHADQLWMAQYALAAPEGLNGDGAHVRLVLDQHNAVYLIPERLAADAANPLKRLILKREAQTLHRYELETCGRFDRVIWVTDEDRRALSAGSQLIGDVTIPICVDTEVKAPVARLPGARRVTFLGSLNWPPNAEGVLWFAREVWPHIVAEMPDAVLTIIGKAPPDSLQTGSPIPNLDVTGYVEDVTGYLAETAVFIVPLHAGGGMRVKIIDAWSWALPIVSTTIGAEGVQYVDGENLLIGDSAHAFAAAVLRLLRDPDLADNIARAGRQTAETAYEWRKIYKAWDGVYGLI